MKHKILAIISLAIILLTAHLAALSAPPKDYPKLLKFFESRSIPVDEIEVGEKVVVARINYGADDEIDEEKTTAWILVVSKKLAEEFSKSEIIRLRYCVEGEEIYALDFVTKDVREGGKGKKKDEEILGEMEIIMPGGGEGKEGVGGEEGELGGSAGGGSEEGNRIDTKVGKVVWLGVTVASSEEKRIRIMSVVDDSPAEHAGLKIGDRIVHIDGQALSDVEKDIQKFGTFIQKLPTDRPVQVNIERENRQFDVWVKLKEIERKEFDKFFQDQAKKLSNNLTEGQQLLGQNKFSEASEYFNKSLKLYPMESYQGLGICYYHMEKYKEARKNIEKAYRLDRTVPLNVFYTAACRDVLEKTNTAIFHYKEYLAMNHDNAEMNEFAKRRIETLKARNRKKTSESFVKLLDAIIKEIKK
jgi:hypothetical protein